MIIQDEGLIGTIKKINSKYEVNVSFSGWGSLSLFEVLTRIGAIDKLESLNNGQEIIFRDRFAI